MTKPSVLQFGRAKRLPVILQTEAAECGLACIAMVASYHGYVTDLHSLRQKFSLSTRGATLKNLVDICQTLRFHARPVKVELDDLRYLRLPCILHWNLSHFVVLKEVKCSVDGSLISLHLHDPSGGYCTIKLLEASKLFTGIALEVSPAPDFKPVTDARKFKIKDLAFAVSGLRSAGAQVFGLAIALELISLVVPLFIQFAIDGSTTSADKGMLTTWALGFLLLVVAQTFIRGCRSWTILYFSTHLNMQWVSSAFTHLLHLPLPFFEKRHLGDIVSRFNSIGIIQTTISTKFIESIFDGMFSLIIMLVMWSYSPRLATVVISITLIYGIVRLVTFNMMRRMKEEQISLQAREQSLFLESLRGVQAIKLFNQEGDRHTRWLNAFASAINRGIGVQKLHLGFENSSFFLSGVESVLVIWIGANLVIENSISVGMLFAFLTYKYSFTSRAYPLIDKWQEIKMLDLHSERLGDIVLTPRENIDAISPSDAHSSNHDELYIELKDVSFRYSDIEPWIINNISVRINAGESVAVVGHSGCGKTTLLKLLVGILVPTSGEIIVGGMPITKFGIRQYRALIGVVMQDDHLFSGTIADNISFFDDALIPGRVEDCAIAAAIATDIASMPMRYQTLIGDMGTSLSGGQKQRLLLARAFYKNPRLLFLDEATSHLDMQNERKVNESVKRLHITRVIVAHRQETIDTVERIIELKDGVIVRDYHNEEKVPSF